MDDVESEPEFSGNVVMQLAPEDAVDSASCSARLQANFHVRPGRRSARQRKSPAKRVREQQTRARPGLVTGSLSRLDGPARDMFLQVGVWHHITAPARYARFGKP